MTAAPLLAVEGLRKWFPQKPGGLGRLSGRAPTAVQAVTDVSFTLRRGEVLGLVGESGSGKTTIGQCVMRLHEPSAGRIMFDGTDVAALPSRAMRPLRQRMQMVFQDPYASLNPRLRVGDSIAEPLETFGLLKTRAERTDRVAELLETVGLRADHAGRYPHEFSGGQRQRIGIARAIAPGPELIVADEPVSALDVSVQAQIVALIEELRARLGLTMLLIAHDLAVVEYVSDRVAVLYLGRVMEIGPAREVYRTPRHPYTRALLSAVPEARPHADRGPRIVLRGDIPSPLNPPSGCPFRTRCPEAVPACGDAVPPLRDVGADHAVACIRQEIA
ncbi:ABC transporter ATP-binding protein [Roseomonas sp. OT10]|uniref:ABC transporter ATP-binding protein n=1 Tax=Roseomonas cutis TaxID=2897332 RepID=UPI001E2B1BC2|nr:ABC transporter ATP-binding protein [Roseomonas sp. OT10]UFN48367.1 ABC transporter ATP-binding protein [Roseomonas sp. OT10]